MESKAQKSQGTAVAGRKTDPGYGCTRSWDGGSRPTTRQEQQQEQQKQEQKVRAEVVPLDEGIHREDLQQVCKLPC